MTTTTTSRTAGMPLRVALWIAQLVVAALFIMSGAMKLFMPVAQISAQMPWTGQVPEAFLRTIGVIDLAGGIGVLLPALTRIAPRLTPIAAVFAAVLQVCAIAFHASRGEFAVLPLNFILLPLAVFIAWGRFKRAPIAPRSAAQGT